MKTTWAKSTVRVMVTSAVMLAISSPAWSGGDIKLVPLPEGSKAAVSFVGTRQSDASIAIENMDRTVRYYSAELKNAEDYKKLFDFSHLADGTYCLIANIDGQTVRKTFIKEGDKVITEEMRRSKEQAFEPMFRKIDNTLVCYYQNPDAEDVNVQFAADNEPFFTDGDDSGKIFFKRYDLSKLPKGTYNVGLWTGSYYYSYQLKIE